MILLIIPIDMKIEARELLSEIQGIRNTKSKLEELTHLSKLEKFRLKYLIENLDRKMSDLERLKSRINDYARNGLRENKKVFKENKFLTVKRKRRRRRN